MLKQFFCIIVYGTVCMLIFFIAYNTNLFNYDYLREHQTFFEKQNRSISQQSWSSTESTTQQKASGKQHSSTITISQFKNAACKYLHQRPFHKFLDNLSDGQVDDIIRQANVKNLTTQDARRQFIYCSIFSLVRRKGAPSDHVEIPRSAQKCNKMSFQDSGTPIALVSFPGSGNSWVRVLLEETTGIYTGSVYCDKHYLFSGMIGEGVSTENVIAIKSHLSVDEMVSYCKKVIYIIRNPLNAIVAEYTRVTAKAGHTKELPPEYYGTNKEWNKQVTKMANEWKQHIEQWIHTDKFTKLVLCYENMIGNLHASVKKMLEFIEYPYTEDEIRCAIRSSNDERFHRKHSKVFDPYTQSQREYVLKKIESVNYILKQYNITYI